MTITVPAGPPITKPSAPWPTDSSASCTAACATSLLRRAHRLARTPTTRCLTSTDRGMSTELAVGARVRLNPRRLMPVAAGSPPAPGPVTGCGPPGHGPDAHNGPSPMEVIRPEVDALERHRTPGSIGRPTQPGGDRGRHD